MKKLLFIIFFLICLSGYSQTFKEVIEFWGSGLPKIEVIKNLDLKKIAENQYNKFAEVIVKKNYHPITGLLDGVFFNEDFEGTYNQGALNCDNCKLYLKANAKRYSRHEDAFYIGNVVNGYLEGEFTVAKEEENYSSREWTFEERARIISLLGPTDATDYFIVNPRYTYRSGTEINKIADLNYKKNNLIGNQFFYDDYGAKIVEINFDDQDIIGFISYNEENKSIVKDSIVNDSKVWKVDNKYIINDKSELAIRKVLDILEDDYERFFQLISNFNTIDTVDLGIRDLNTLTNLIEKKEENAKNTLDNIKEENIVAIDNYFNKLLANKIRFRIDHNGQDIVESLNIKLKINKVTITPLGSGVKIEFWNNEVRDGFLFDVITEAPENYIEIISKIKF
jgi:hypothetical protein